MAKYIKTEEGYKDLEESVSAVTDNKMDKTNPTGTGYFSMNRKAGTVIGVNSHAEGFNTTASGFCSHAEGDNTIASGTNSHAEGSSTKASGSYSHAEGYKTTASGDYSHAEGFLTTASGGNSHAEGNSTNAFLSVVTTTNPTTGDIITTWKTKKFSIAKGNYSHVEGRDNLALGNYSHAEGGNTQASNTYSHAEGSNTIANGFGSHTEGGGATASGDYSHAEGSSTKASGNYSHAEGTSTTASGYSSHTEGTSTTASGPYSHTEGDSTTASGYSSHAEGISTEASGDKSHAEGGYTTASGNYSHAEGRRTKASGKYSHAQGIFNIEDTSNIYADIIGNGTSDTARSNAATVDWKGNAWFAGDVYTGSTSGTNKDEGSKKLATEEYVNSSIAAGGSDISLGLTSASVGQIIKVKAVDESGKPTEWEVADAGELKFTKIYEHTVTAEEATTVTEYKITKEAVPNLGKYNIFVAQIEFAEKTAFSKWVKLKVNNDDVAGLCGGVSTDKAVFFSASVNRLLGRWCGMNVYDTNKNNGAYMITLPCAYSLIANNALDAESVSIHSYVPDFGLVEGAILRVYASK